MLKSYIKNLYEIFSKGDATEASYYSALKSFLEEYAKSIKKKIFVTTIPKKTEAGSPDFRVWDGENKIVGYIEGKSPEIKYLDQIETTEQIKRYLYTFPNLILTNFFEFRFYKDGKQIESISIARHFIVQKLKTLPPVENEEKFFRSLEQFFSFSLPKISTAKTLAMELAKRTRFLRDEIITEQLNKEGKKGKGAILGFYEAFKRYLIRGITEEEFADMYSQTITYGLFAARTRSQNEFNRKLAYDNIPPTIGILRDVFKFISLGDVPQQMEIIIDDISGVLAVTDVHNILHQYFYEGKGKDPIVHFYETFLNEYDPETREKRGVYYTPESVVFFIVRSIHYILKEQFNRKDGFANDDVTVLDPAAGTLTFLAEAAKLSVQGFISKYGEGGKKDFIKNNILKNFYAFELMMAPYAVGHLRMSFLLEELGYKLEKEDRFNLYLTNTLEMEELAQTDLPGMVSLSEESHLAGKVKKEQPILVILGNPPYSGISSNVSEKEVNIDAGQEYIAHYQINKDEKTGIHKLVPQFKKAKKNIRVKQKTWIGELIEYYKIIDGQWLKERKIWLQDDYVKFIRFAQWKIDKMGEGILGFITNHSYLDNSTFRGMRQSLINSFNEIYILNLHGNSLKKETSPDGSKDENVFDIQQGVAIALFIKKKGDKQGCIVYYKDVWGLREKKYVFLLKEDLTTKWKKLTPTTPYYFFVPREEKGRKIYEKFWKITDIFPIYSTGVVTARDNFVIDIDRESLKRRIAMFMNLSMPDEIIQQTFRLKDTRGWKLFKARENLAKDTSWERYFTKILYRPFDAREIYYSSQMVDWPRLEVMKHMVLENLGLLTCRQQNKIGFYHAFISNTISESCVVSNKTKEINYLFPLYLYQEKVSSKKKSFGTMMLFEDKGEYAIKKPNLSQILLEKLKIEYKKLPTPEEIFYYIYAILYSNVYRTKYAEFLRIDFPRVPFTDNSKIFSKMAEYGKKLIELHLLKSPELDSPIIKFYGEGDDYIKKVIYKEKRVYINDNKYFEPVKLEIWKYQIGGYEVCDKWLKDRKGKKLEDGYKTYCKIVAALQKTIKIQKEIDNIYLKIETTFDM